MILEWLSDKIYVYLVFGLLVLCGIYFTIKIRFSQITLLPESVKYLKELCEAVEVSTDRFFMVPGNHDIDREIEKRDQAVKKILNNHGSESENDPCI